MKATGLFWSCSFSLCAGILLLCPALDAQVVSETNAAPPSAPLSWQITARDTFSTTHEATETVTDAVTGEMTNRVHRYIAVGSGLNYLDETGQWVASQDLIELTADGGAAAIRGPTKVLFKANLNNPGAITLTTVSNRVVRTRPVGLAYYDVASGRAVVLSTLKDCGGELLPPNQVVYKSAFASLEADVRYTATKAAFESDVILRQKPPPPEAFGLNPRTTRLEVWHDFGEAPSPNRKARPLTPDLADEILDYGDLWFPTGAAYWSDGSVARDTNTAASIRIPDFRPGSDLVPVGKSWLATPAGSMLVEAVSWPAIQSKLQDLPLADGLSAASLPQDRLACFTELLAASPAGQTGGAITTASAAYAPVGCVLDYITVNSTYNDYTFASGQTYYVASAPTTLSGTVTFQGCSTIKYNNGVYLLLTGTVYFDTSAASTVLTTKDDDSFGEPHPNSTHCPSYAADKALWLYYNDQNLSINGVKIRWAQTAVYRDANGCGEYSDTFWDSGVEFCQTGLYANNCYVYVSDVWKCNVATESSTAGCGYVSGSMASDTCSGDADQDGMADWWEFKYFGSTGALPSSDTDGDGLTNLQEYLHGSNPTIFHAATSYGQTLMTGVGQPINFNLLGSSRCNEPIAFWVWSGYGPNHGSLNPPVTGQNRTYTPNTNPNFAGADDFIYSAGDSDGHTITIYVTPGPELSAECRQDRIVLTWNISTVEQTPGLGFGFPHGFRVYRSAVSGGPYTLLTTQPLDPAARMYIDTPPTQGQDYFYVVKFLRNEAYPLPPPSTIEYLSPPSNEVKIKTCPLPPGQPTDIVFIVDNTGSVTLTPTLATVIDGVLEAMDEIVAASTVNSQPDYRLALITPDNDQVHVRLKFTNNNRQSFENELDDLPDLGLPVGNRIPESTDECILTAISARAAVQVNPPVPPPCADRPPPPSPPGDPSTLQIGDFTPAFSKTNKLIVLITDAEPGGFCDPEAYLPDPHGLHALAIAQAAHDLYGCIKINAIQVPNKLNVLDANAASVMQDYAGITCGWYSQIPVFHMEPISIKEAILKMIYVPGACSCP